MTKNRSPSVQYVHEVATSINIALTGASVFLSSGPNYATKPFFDLDRTISLHLGLASNPNDVRIAKDSFSPGYFAYFIAAFAFAVCVWLSLRLFAGSVIVREFLRSVAGILALAVAPLGWLWFHRWGHPIMSSEIALIVLFGMLYSFGVWAIPEWTIIVAVVLHFGFWLYEFGSYFSFRDFYAVLPAVSVCAGLTWIFYVRRLHVGLAS
jgi:hypothetical protein